MFALCRTLYCEFLVHYLMTKFLTDQQSTGVGTTKEGELANRPHAFPQAEESQILTYRKVNLRIRARHPRNDKQFKHHKR